MALSGLDLSGAAIEVARERLADLEVDLQVGSIERTTYEDGTFDVVTCNASMSYWQDPVACFDEVYRILKPGGAAVLFEPQKEIDLDEVVATIKENLADAGPWRRFLAVNLNRFALRWGRGVGLTLRSEAELSELAGRSRFGEDHRIERVTLQNLPIFACITLVKPEEEPDRG
jgi:ubiquinone/menaquinone biosynthesis C-methylase UbiE